MIGQIFLWSSQVKIETRITWEKIKPAIIWTVSNQEGLIILYTPDWACLVHWESFVILIIWGIRKRTRCFALWIWILQNCNTSNSGPEGFIHKPSTGHNVIITACILIHCNQERVRLSHMDVEICEILLHCVWTFCFNKGQVVVLNPEVQACGDTHIMDTETVCFSCWVEDVSYQITAM